MKTHAHLSSHLAYSNFIMTVIFLIKKGCNLSFVDNIDILCKFVSHCFPCSFLLWLFRVLYRPSPHLSLCLSWRPAVWMCHSSTNATDFFPLLHTNSSPFVPVLFQRPLFQRHTGGTRAKHSLGSIPSCDSCWLFSAPAQSNTWI